MVRAHIISTGMAVPEKVLTNHDLEKIVDTTDKWIRERTGMYKRHISDDSIAASDLAVEAAQQALDAAGIKAEELDAILLATISGDYSWPATACIVQHRLGAKNAMAVDLSAACTGFLYGLSSAQAYIESGMYKNILLVGVDLLSKVVDWEDRNSCVLFGDGAGAVVIQPTDDDKGVIRTILGSDGGAANLLCRQCGGSRIPISHKAIDEKKHFLYLNGREIFKQAVRVMSQTAVEVLEKCGKTTDDVNLVIPHQANMRIIDAIASRLGVSMDRFFNNVEDYANTSSATIPIAMHEAMQQGRLKEGDLLLTVAFGAGLTWGSSLIQF